MTKENEEKVEKKDWKNWLIRKAKGLTTMIKKALPSGNSVIDRYQ